MEPVQSPTTQALQDEAITEAKFEAARKLVAKRLAFQKAIREGRLTREQFDSLPADFKTWYKQNHGVPSTKAEKLAEQRKLDHRRKKNKAAKKARKVSRQRSR